ncbi:MAG TPA: serine/threonine-protein kinase [Polyangiaceae bacterium]
MGCRAAVYALVVLAALLVTGCASDPVVSVTAWTLSVDGSPPKPVTLPTHLDLPRHECTYTLHSDVALPDAMRGRPLTLAIVYLPAHVRLSVDGEPATELGLGLDLSTHAPGPWQFHIPAERTSGPRVGLDLSIRHQWTQSGWLDAAPRLSATEQGDAWFLFVSRYNRVTSIVAVLTLLAGAFQSLLVFFPGMKRKAYGWFTLEALLSAVYPAFLLGLTQLVFGPYEIAFGGVFLTMSAVSAVHFAHVKFGLGPPHWGWRALVGVAAVTGVVTHDPFWSTYGAVPVAGPALLAAAAYHVRLYFRFRRDPSRAPAHYRALTLVWPVCMGIAGSDFAAWFGLGQVAGGLRGAPIGIALALLVQSAVLSREHFGALRQADLLNEELRRQIAARSLELEELTRRLGKGLVTPAALAPGEVVEGRYRVVRELGAGGSGRVYQVKRVSDDRSLALKVLTTADEPAALVRFAREAHIAARVKHPNVVSVVDVAVAGAGFLFLVMEYVDGPNVRRATDHRGDPAWTMAVLGQVADGLAALHEAGIVHRDLKPANVLIVGGTEGSRPLVKIADFGISVVRASDAAPARSTENEETLDVRVSGRRPKLSDPNLTSVGDVMGTPMYMAPELLAGALHASAASDVFAFGAMAYEMLTGERPFANVEDRMLDERRAIPVRERAAWVSPSVAAAVEACLAREPADRPSARELVEAFSGASRATTQSA